MIEKEIKETILSYYSQCKCIPECVALYDGIVCQSTIYKWINENKQKTLYYKYTRQECLKEWDILWCNCNPSYDRGPNTNRIVLTYQPHFFKQENKLFQNKSIRKNLIENRKKYLNKTKLSDKELLRGFKISGIHIGYSHFSPYWIKKFIQNYNPRVIYDPCGGWGHRLLGVASCDISYIYNDIWTQTYNGVLKIARLINYTKGSFYNNDCTTFTPQEDYDCIFTCPPYYNTEIYNQPPFETTLDYHKFLHNMFNACIKPCVNIIGIVINDKYKEAVEKNIPEDFRLRKEIQLGSTKLVSPLTGKENTTKQEILLVFERTCKEEQLEFTF